MRRSNAERARLILRNGQLFIRPSRSLVSTEYLSFVISSASMRRHLEGVAQGVTMANLNKDLVGALPIPMPPLALPQTFATRIQAVESLKATHRAALAESDALFASLQHRAFAGQLS